MSVFWLILQDHQNTAQLLKKTQQYYTVTKTFNKIYIILNIYYIDIYLLKILLVSSQLNIFIETARYKFKFNNNNLIIVTFMKK